MTDESAGANGLDHLARLAGIESEYWDIWGNLHRTGDAGKVSILGALGFAADSEAAIAASTASIEQAAWAQGLPPVAVFRLGQAIEISLVLPAARGDRGIACRILEEGGHGHHFTVVPDQGALVEEREIAGEVLQRRILNLPVSLPLGYHDLYLDLGEEALGSGELGHARLIVAPPGCYLPEPLAGGARRWGISTHLYSLRREGDWGIGDFTGLAALVDLASELGAALIGLNPLHALFLEHPDRASPYSPSSRLFLNPLYIDPEAVADFAESRKARSVAKSMTKELASLRAATFIDYAKVAACKRRIFSALFENFRDRHLASSDDSDGRAAAFAAFVRDGGEPLRRFALFEVLSRHFAGASWTDWPEEFRHCDGPAVVAFAETHRDDLAQVQYLQWQADKQLAAAQARAYALGLPIGMYRDLAVGAAADGADSWIAQDVIVNSATVGCPPDPFNMLGQDWGTPPLHPLALRAQGYAAFANIVRANMRHAGALRIDHVMGLLHLFWIPAGQKPDSGAYIQYPFEDLLAVLALESHRNKCLVVGEDLGTVPEGFRERMAAANVLSYRVLYFEKDGERFKQPTEYPKLALACVTTHDLATLAGFWGEADIDLKRELSLYPDAASEEGERASRQADRDQLLAALESQGLLGDPGSRPAEGAAMDPALSAAVHRYLSRSPVSLLLVQIDDLTEETEQLNLPGTDRERANWRRRLHLPIRDIRGSAVISALATGLEERSARPQSTEP
ncbi:MAG: 4-alpha-glucanotransferase [Rhodospirillales bacterium]|nr:4-alpha-glucanotransferase [Rhodospirillales bacterium]